MSPTQLGTRLGTMLGTQLGQDPTRGGLRADFRALFRTDGGGADTWIDASNVEVVAGKVRSLYDYIDPAHALAQLTSANQCPVSTVDTALAGALSIAFTTTQTYLSTRPAAAWAYLHNGQGQNVFHVFVPTASNTINSLVSTMAGSTAFPNTSVGYLADFYSSGSHGQEFYVSNGDGVSANKPVYNAAAGTVRTLGVGSYMETSYVEGASPEWRSAARGTVVASGDSTTAPSASSPTLTLALGNIAGINARMRWRASYFFRRVLTPLERATVQAWIKAETGVSP